MKTTNVLLMLVERAIDETGLTTNRSRTPELALATSHLCAKPFVGSYDVLDGSCMVDLPIFVLGVSDRLHRWAYNLGS